MSTLCAQLTFSHDLDEVTHFCQEHHRHGMVPFSVYPIGRFMMSMCLISSRVNLDLSDVVNWMVDPKKLWPHPNL